MYLNVTARMVDRRQKQNLGPSPPVEFPLHDGHLR